jgi:putative cell wall-binding protein
MHPYTIIPEGAKKLLAYGANGKVLSDEYVAYDLPEGCATYHIGEALEEFQIVSDIHITADGIPSGGETKLSNTHLRQMLEDTNTLSPESLGIFVVGDIANNGRDEEFQETQKIYNTAVENGNTNLPLIHLIMGNHDWYNNNPSKQFQKWCKLLNTELESAPDTTYYDEVINGYHFVYLASEERGDSLRAVISKKQLDWFDNIMAQATEEDPDKPVFVFLHQSFYNTVAGSLPGQNWDGVANEENLKSVMAKYGQIILFNGHSHWDLNSIRCAYGGDEEAPAALNTASVSYLWSSYNITSGEFWDGSQGYNVKVYDDKVLFLGREYEQNVYLPSAMFVIQRDDITTESDDYYLSLNTASINIEAKSATGDEITYTSEDPLIADVLDDGTVIAKKVGDVKIRMRTKASNTHVVGMKTVTVHISDKNVVRLYGDTRYTTAIKAANEYKEQLGVDKFDAVILACGDNFADALAGSYLATVRKAPILLVRNRAAEIKLVQDYIKENLKENGTIYMLGGTAVVPDSAVAGLSGFKSRRLGGTDRYDTNVKILKEAARYADGAEEYIIASGNGFADSLSASATGRPILLVKNAVQPSQKAYIDSLKGKKFYIAGGTGAVSPDMENVFKALGTTKRIGGATRYETSTNLALEFFDKPPAAVLAYGANFPDGLCAGPIAYAMDAPLILTGNGKADAAVEYATKNGVVYGFILGGPTLINDFNAKKIFSLSANAEILVK